mgnify:CR=1 FL=1
MIESLRLTLRNDVDEDIKVSEGNKKRNSL